MLMRASTSATQAWGSMPFSRAVWINLYITYGALAAAGGVNDKVRAEQDIRNRVIQDLWLKDKR
jgi:hypothetical protein